MHDGFQNTYSFSKGGKKITLKPLAPSELHKNKPTKKLEHYGYLRSFSETLLKASNHEFRAFEEWILNVQDEPESPMRTHPIAKSLIQEFYHLFQRRYPRVYLPKEKSNITSISFLVQSFQISQPRG